MTMKWMISFQSSGICSVNNARNAFQFPCINSFNQKREFLKRDIWDQTKCRYCEIGILKCISCLYSAYLKKKNDLKRIRWIYPQKSFPIIFAVKSPFFLLFIFPSLMSKTCQGFICICSRKNNPNIHEYNFLLIVKMCIFQDWWNSLDLNIEIYLIHKISIN